MKAIRPTTARFGTSSGASLADLVADATSGLSRMVRRHRVASSGHGLWEESLIHHPALQGNAIKALTRMDIPGLDVLTSNPRR